MKLARFEIHNFKGLRELVLDWDDILVLIGENNCGKSSVLQALEWFLSGKKLSDDSTEKTRLREPELVEAGASGDL
jgi:putative ATP-dependent endonuclease of OLD family